MLTRDLFAGEVQSRELRPYQEDGLASLRASIRQGIKRMVLQLPTGAGKTRVSAAIVEGALSKGNGVSFVVPRISLVDQTVDEFAKEGITSIGVMQANHYLTDMDQPVQVCSIDTVRRRAFPDSRVVIFDEVHMFRETHQQWMTERPDAIFIGLSATPWTKGLGKHFQSLLIVATMKELMLQGWLCRYRAFGASNPDLSGIKTLAGDYHEGQLSERLRTDDVLVGDIVDTWKKRHGKDRTLLFAVDRAHARVLQDRFERADIPCGYQDAHTPDDERQRIKRQFHSGELPVVASVGTLIVGVDYDVRCISFCRATKSEMLFVQAFGRGTRLAPKGADPKEHLIFLDHSGTIGRLGYPEDILYDRLHDGQAELRQERKPPLPKPCPSCAMMFRGRNCPNCGFERVPQTSAISEQEGELVELTPGVSAGKQKRGGKREYSMVEKRQWFAELKAYVASKGHAPGRAAHLYREKFDCWPDHSIKFVGPAEYVSLTMESWIRSRNIAWAKRRDAQNGVTKVDREQAADQRIDEWVKAQYAGQEAGQ